ncbi:MAG TPA: HIT domain-containing protein [Verrucomicrobiae bacterium]|nr:HIT domain-containing protein [Verrucomicrobiae bacterium]
MKELANPVGIKLKGFLFLLIGFAAAILIFLDEPTLKTTVLVLLAIWSFCRFYYFAFYVIEKYVDPGFKFSGLISFANYLFSRRPKIQPFDFNPARIYPVRMDTLYAPWRIEYIQSPKPELKPGLFTRIAQSSDDEANYVIVRDRTCFALLNAYPYVGGHLMVVPYKEVPDMNGLTDEELADLWKLTRRCINALRALMKADGFNVGINLGKVAGAGIADHLHIHVVPRWNGDTNFMPVIANATVLPEALKEMAAKLRAELAHGPGGQRQA